MKVRVSWCFPAVCWLLLLLVATADSASAQQITNLPLLPGSKVLSGTLPADATGIDVQVNSKDAGLVSVSIQQGTFTVELKTALAAGDQVTVRAFAGGKAGDWSKPVTVGAGAAPPVALDSLPLAPGATSLSGTIASDAFGVEIQINEVAARLKSLQLSAGKFQAELESALQAGNEIRVRQVLRNGNASAWTSESVLALSANLPTIQDLPLRENTSLLKGTVPPGTSGLEIKINGQSADLQWVRIDSATNTFEARLKKSLEEGQKVRLLLHGKASAGTVEEEVRSTCDDETDYDCREDVEISGFLGLGIDTFASGTTKRYLNPDASTGKEERMVGGFDFAARLLPVNTRRRAQNATSGSGFGFANQLWIYGETVHGIRSMDIDCSKHTDFPTCIDNGIGNTLPNDPLGKILFTIRNASSLEVLFGLRYEFLTTNKQGQIPLNWYVKGQAGFLTARGNPDDVVDSHHIGLGVMATKSRIQDSYFEFGYGRTDLFAAPKNKGRWKFDGQFSIELVKGMSFFAQLTADTDFGHGSDSVQSYYGLGFDIKQLVRSLLPPP